MIVLLSFVAVADSGTQAQSRPAIDGYLYIGGGLKSTTDRQK